MQWLYPSMCGEVFALFNFTFCFSFILNVLSLLLKKRDRLSIESLSRICLHFYYFFLFEKSSIRTGVMPRARCVQKNQKEYRSFPSWCTVIVDTIKKKSKKSNKNKDRCTSIPPLFFANTKLRLLFFLTPSLRGFTCYLYGVFLTKSSVMICVFTDRGGRKLTTNYVPTRTTIFYFSFCNFNYQIFF